MKILYIHGIDSSPNPERIAHLEELGHRVSALHLDYRSTPDTYEQLKEVVAKEKIQYLVGSSFGGFLAYWLGEELGLPALLFNPAMHVSPAQANFGIPASLRSPKRRVVLGARDDVVDPNMNWEFFKKGERPGMDQRVILCQWLAHQIDIDTFVDACNWARL